MTICKFYLVDFRFFLPEIFLENVHVVEPPYKYIREKKWRALSRPVKINDYSDKDN